MLLCAQAYYVTEPRFNRVAVAVWRLGACGEGFYIHTSWGHVHRIRRESRSMSSSSLPERTPHRQVRDHDSAARGPRKIRRERDDGAKEHNV